MEKSFEYFKKLITKQIQVSHVIFYAYLKTKKSCIYNDTTLFLQFNAKTKIGLIFLPSFQIVFFE